MRLVERLTVNVFHGYCADPGEGKTDLALRHAMEDQERLGAYILALDSNSDMKAEYHDEDGKRHHIKRFERYETIEEMRAAMRPRWFMDKDRSGVHAVRATDPEKVVELAEELVRETSCTRHGKEYAAPAVVLIDEITLWGQATSPKPGKDLLRYLATRRHMHVIFRYCTQSSRMVNALTLDKSNYLSIFRCTVEADLRRLQEGGVPEWLCDVSRGIEKGSHEAVEFAR